jgi:tRNA(Ile)-lysidine synthase
MPVLAAEGGDIRNLARLASRLARANAAVEVLADGAEHYLALSDRDAPQSGFGAKSCLGKIVGAKSFDAKAFAALPEEIRLRLLQRAIDRFGHEGTAELGKVEALLSALDRAGAAKTEGRSKPNGSSGPANRPSLNGPRLKQTLAGALVSLVDGRIRVEPAPPRRHRPD